MSVKNGIHITGNTGSGKTTYLHNRYVSEVVSNRDIKTVVICTLNATYCNPHMTEGLNLQDYIVKKANELKREYTVNIIAFPQDNPYTKIELTNDALNVIIVEYNVRTRFDKNAEMSKKYWEFFSTELKVDAWIIDETGFFLPIIPVANSNDASLKILVSYGRKYLFNYVTKEWFEENFDREEVKLYGQDSPEIIKISDGSLADSIKHRCLRLFFWKQNSL